MPPKGGTRRAWACLAGAAGMMAALTVAWARPGAARPEAGGAGDPPEASRPARAESPATGAAPRRAPTARSADVPPAGVEAEAPTHGSTVALADAAPDRQTFRREVSTNGHAPAPSFVRFALASAGRVTAAVDDVRASEDLADELLAVAESPQQLEVVAATALKHAGALAEAHPHLRQRVAAALEAASPRVRRLADL